MLINSYSILTLFIFIVILVTFYLVYYIVVTFVREPLYLNITFFNMIKTIYFKLDLNTKVVTLSYRQDDIKVETISLQDFEKTLSSERLNLFYNYIDLCLNQETVSDVLKLQLAIDQNVKKAFFYDMKFVRKDDKNQVLHFVLTLDKDSNINKVNVDDVVDFDTFKAIVRSMSDDAYTSVGSLVCIYLKLYEKINERYSDEIAYYYRDTLLKRLKSLVNENTVVSVNNDYLWIYRHGLTRKKQLYRFMSKIKKELGNSIKYQNLEFNVDYCAGTTFLGRFTFSVDMAINQAIQACDNHAVNIYIIQKEFVEYDEKMEKVNTDNYLDYQALKQMINKQEFVPSFYYVFSLYSGLVNDYFIELTSASSHFKYYEDALKCAIKNREEKEFIEASFKSTLETILKQKASRYSTFMYVCDVNMISSLIDIYVSSSKYQRHSLMFAIANFDFSIESNSYDNLRVKLLHYKEQGIKFALVVNEDMKMITHPFFTLFDAFIVPPSMYKNIKEDEKAKLSIIRMIEVLPKDVNVIITGVNDKVEVEILMNGDIEYFCGPILGSTTDLSEKADIITLRKLQYLIRYKESNDIYE